jgi:hypothetical protein
MSRDRPFELHDLIPSSELVERIQARQRQQAGGEPPSKHAKSFVMVSQRWAAALDGASGQTWQVAVLLLHLHWKEHGRPVRLSNTASWAVKIPRRSKWRSLHDLERRGLILIERHRRKAPIIRVFHET